MSHYLRNTKTISPWENIDAHICEYFKIQNPLDQLVEKPKVQIVVQHFQ